MERNICIYNCLLADPQFPIFTPHCYKSFSLPHLLYRGHSEVSPRLLAEALLHTQVPVLGATCHDQRSWIDQIPREGDGELRNKEEDLASDLARGQAILFFQQSVFCGLGQLH